MFILLYLINFCLLGTDISLVNTQALINYTTAKRIEKEKKQLKVAKKEFIDGNSFLGNIYLDLLYQKPTDVAYLIRNHYWGLINFTKMSHSKSLANIQDIKHGHLCPLLLLEQMINKVDFQTLTLSYQSCQRKTSAFSQNRQIFLNYLYYKYIGYSPMSLFSANETNPEIIKVMFKIAIFEKQHKAITSTLDRFPQSILNYQRIRESIGFSYALDNDYEKALDYIYDLKTPNALNIKGIYEYNNNNRQTALNLFKDALKIKKDSPLALSYIIPLSWYFKDFDMLSNLEEDIPLKAISLYHLRRFNDAYRIIKNIKYLSDSSMSHRENLLYSYLSLALNKTESAKNYAFMNCARFDPFNCYTFMQYIMDENFLDRKIKLSPQDALKEVTERIDPSYDL